MISAVVDTNVVVFGFGWPRGAPGQVVEAVLSGRFLLVTSPPLLDELRRVLAYPKLAAVFDDAERLVELVREVGVVVEPRITLDAVADDADNRVLEAAVTAQVDVVVTGDTDLLTLAVYGDVVIVTPKAFLGMLAEDETGQPRS